MATCSVDVEPSSLFGVTCGRLVRDGRCPVHGYMIAPSVYEHPEPAPSRTVQELADLVEALLAS